MKSIMPLQMTVFLLFGGCVTGTLRESKNWGIPGKLTFHSADNHSSETLYFREDGGIDCSEKYCNFPSVSEGRPFSWSLRGDETLTINNQFQSMVASLPRRAESHEYETLNDGVCSVPADIALFVEFAQSEDRKYRYFMSKDPAAVDAYCRKQNEERIAARTVEMTKRFGKKYGSVIARGRVKLGMTKEMVIASIGEPHHVNRTVTSYGSSEQWVFGDLYLYFEGNKLVTFQD